MQQTQFERVYDFGNLYAGFLKARRGKRGKPSVAKFEANLLEALCLLSIMLKNKFFFSNETKTAESWGFNFRIKVKRNGASGDCFISSVGGNFE